MTTEKLIKDGQVAVLISPGWGAGWSTWVDDERSEAAVFDPELAQAVLDGKDERALEEIANRRYPDDYHGGLRELTVKWLPIGTQFVVDEHDGSEYLRMVSSLRYTA